MKKYLKENVNNIQANMINHDIYEKYTNYRLHPWWVTGFTDAEGNFSINYAKKSNKITASFKVTQMGHSKKVLTDMLDFFGCGYVYVDNAKFDGYKFTISKYEDLLKVVIPHFDKYELKGSKRLDFLDFKKAILLFEKSRFSNMDAILALKQGMNTKRSYEDRWNHFNNIPPLNIEPEWLQAFIDGEGTFQYRLAEVINRGKPYLQQNASLEIAQNSHDVKLLMAIRDFFGHGYIKPKYNISSLQAAKSSRSVNRFCINQDSVVIPFVDKYPMLTRKRLDYEDYKLLSDLRDKKFHLHPQGLELMRALKLGMNRGRSLNLRAYHTKVDRENNKNIANIKYLLIFLLLFSLYTFSIFLDDNIKESFSSIEEREISLINSQSEDKVTGDKVIEDKVSEGNTIVVSTMKQDTMLKKDVESQDNSGYSNTLPFSHSVYNDLESKDSKSLADDKKVLNDNISDTSSEEYISSAFTSAEREINTVDLMDETLNKIKNLEAFIANGQIKVVDIDGSKPVIDTKVFRELIWQLCMDAGGVQDRVAEGTEASINKREVENQEEQERILRVVKAYKERMAATNPVIVTITQETEGKSSVLSSIASGSNIPSPTPSEEQLYEELIREIRSGGSITVYSPVGNDIGNNIPSSTSQGQDQVHSDKLGNIQPEGEPDPSIKDEVVKPQPKQFLILTKNLPEGQNPMALPNWTTIPTRPDADDIEAVQRWEKDNAIRKAWAAKYPFFNEEFERETITLPSHAQVSSQVEETIIPSQISERVRDTFKKDISDDDSYNLEELFGEKSYRNDSDPNGRNNRNDNEK
jgi:hypothetical protein